MQTRLSLIAAGTVAALVLAGCSTDSAQSPASSSSVTTTPPSPTATVTAGTQTVTVSLGEAAQLGALSYLISSVTDLGKSLETPEGSSITNGAFVAASVRAQNSSAKPYRLNPEDLTATTSGGDVIRANYNDSIVANGNDPAFNQPVKNGAVVVGQVVFNFPRPPRGEVKTITIRDGSGGTVIVTV